MNKEKEILRFSTAGSVDDGKSTLIGRILHDTKSLFKDQIQSIEDISKKKGYDYVDLSLLTDGLKSEREQGITIDVAYRYFSTPKRKFIIADTPGHIQYTRNMVTGASTSALAVILIDARNGIVEQTFRHTFISYLLGIKHLIVCVNKMDLVNYNQSVYDKIVSKFKDFLSRINISDIKFIPISALEGDNVVKKSKNMNWYKGSTLIYNLENVHIASDYDRVNPRFPIQHVIRPKQKDFHDFRGYAGKVVGGIFKKGDIIKVLPQGYETRIKSIQNYTTEIDKVFPPYSAMMTIEDDYDIDRGAIFVKPNNIPSKSNHLNTLICWMSNSPLISKKKYLLKHCNNIYNCILDEVDYKIDVNTLHKLKADHTLLLNEIGRVKIKCSDNIFYDSYDKNRITGSFIIIDSNSNETVGAGILK